MSRSIVLVCMILVVSVYASDVEATRYVVEPVELSDGYAITGGFIETNTVGPLTPGDISDYLLTVEGEVPHVFSNNDDGSRISIDGTLSATDGRITIPFGEDFGDYHDITFSSQFASLNYRNGYEFFFVPSVQYRHADLPASDDSSLWLSGRHVSMPDLTTIVVASVPEPSSATLMFLSVCVLAARMRQNRVRREDAC